MYSSPAVRKEGGVGGTSNSSSSTGLQFYSQDVMRHQSFNPACSPSSSSQTGPVSTPLRPPSHPFGTIGGPSFGSSSIINDTSSSSFSVPPLAPDSTATTFVEPEPPLLEELGINPDHILKRMRSVLLFYKLDEYLLADSDMSGPLLIILTLGFSLLLSGKPIFGYIYGLGIMGGVGTYLLLNLMSQKQGIDLYRTMSILGYGLLPSDVLALLSLFVKLRTLTGTVVSVVCIFWCTATASRFFETALQMRHQRFLVAYPIGLLYTCFVLIIVF